MMVAVGHASQTRSPLPAAPDAYLQCCQANANPSPVFTNEQVSRKNPRGVRIGLTAPPRGRLQRAQKEALDLRNLSGAAAL